MLLTRTANAGVTSQSRLARGLAGVMVKTIDRRTFLKRSGITAGAAGIASQLPLNMIKIAEAKDEQPGKVEVKRTVCTHCSV
ncbi:MAG TPA: twin-arginine translocation signal domain-containing protein, partial [Burkholderiales bacterium]|nr:twin-arginine translocation signal domain-containing protein [Burkholderiales bacterium]